MIHGCSNCHLHVLHFLSGAYWSPDRQWMRVQVNYVGKAANLYEDAGYKLSGSAYVVNKHLGTTWLWDRVRVSGGAYGGFSDFDTHSGMFSFLSYRDPNLTKTVRAAPRLRAPSLAVPSRAGCPLLSQLQSPPPAVSAVMQSLK